MNMKRSLLVGATLATVTLGGGGLALAATDTLSSSSGDGTSLVERIATKFNLNQSDAEDEAGTVPAGPSSEATAEMMIHLQAVTMTEQQTRAAGTISTQTRVNNS